MKKFIILLLAIMMCLACVACGNDAEKADKYCWNCGKGITLYASFCENCGAAVNDNKDKATPMATVVETQKPVETQVPTVEPTATPTQKPTATPTVEPTAIPTQKPTATPTQKPTATPHTHSYSKKVTEATCTKNGYTTYTCSCGDTYKDNYTNPSHQYVKHVCFNCGKIDTTHAYEYLIEWIKSNGEADAEFIHFDYYTDGDDFIRYSLTYDATDNYLSVNKGTYYNDVYYYSDLRLDIYSCYVVFGELKVFGYINASEFTDNYPIEDAQYTGPSDNKWDMIELARISTNDLLSWLDWCLTAYNIGITIKDLGFLSYQTDFV